MKVILTIDKSTHNTSKSRGLWTRLMWYKTGLWAKPSHSLFFEYLWRIHINIFISIRNQFDILLTAVSNVSKGQIDIAYNGEHQALTKQVWDTTFGQVVQPYLYQLYPFSCPGNRSNCAITWQPKPLFLNLSGKLSI